MTRGYPTSPTLIAYDAAEKRVHLIFVNSHGEVSDHRCQWADDKALTCEPLTIGSGDDRVINTVTITIDGDRSTYHEVGTGEKAFDFYATGMRTGP